MLTRNVRPATKKQKPQIARLASLGQGWPKGQIGRLRIPASKKISEMIFQPIESISTLLTCAGAKLLHPYLESEFQRTRSLIPQR